MLSFESNAMVLEPDGVCVHRDHEDPLAWYYLPMRPSISRDAQGNPLLSLTKYTSDKDDFGILNLDVNLGLDPALLSTYTQKLKTRLALRETPRLLPMLAKAGSVEVMLLGRKTGDGASSYVKGIVQAASPALYNDNRAVFSILLDKDGTQIVEASLKGAKSSISPIGIIYSLNFEALQPAYNLKASASWKTIHQVLRKQFKANGIFLGTDIAKVIEDLKEQRVIKFELENMRPADEPAALQAMVGQVRTMVFEQFFKPAPTPERAQQPSFINGLTDLMNAGSKLATSGRLSFLGNFTWIEEDRTEIIDKTLEIDLRERSVVNFKLHPQAFLSDLVPRDAGTSLVQEVNGSNPDFFTRRSLTVDLNQALDLDGISSVVVDLDYSGRKQSLIFKKNDEAAKKCTWTSAKDATGKFLRDVHLSYTINFATRNDGSIPSSLKASPQPVLGDYFTVAPRTLYSMDTIRFMVRPGFDWQQCPVITLNCRYEDIGNDIQLTRTTALMQPTEKNPAETSWTFLRTNLRHRAYRYQLVYPLQSGRKVDLGWTTSDLSLVVLDPPTLSLQVTPPKAAEWPSGVDNIMVDIAYEDRANNVNINLPVKFEKGQDEPRQLKILVADTNLRTVSYTVTHQGVRGATGPRSRTQRSGIYLGSQLLGRTFSTLKPSPSLFENSRVTKVTAKLRHIESGIPAQTVEKTFASADERFQFEYDFLADATYRCKLVFHYTNAPTFTTKEIEINQLDQYQIELPQQ